MTSTFLGANIDTRPQSEKDKDFQFREVVASANPVTWVEKTLDECRRFPAFDQDGSGSCVAQTEAKELGILRSLKDGQYVHFSATDIYQRRVNRPAGGMGAVDARSIASSGVTLEALSPSQNLTDAQMDSAVIEPYKREVGAVFAVPNFLALPIMDIDAIASVIQTTKKGVMVWFYFNANEWSQLVPSVQDPTLQLSAVATLRHSVTAVDFLLYNGKKALKIEDSAHFGGLTERIITEDFFKTRNWYAGYLVNFRFENQESPTPPPVVIPRPKYTFLKTLEFKPLADGQSVPTDVDVAALQDILKYEGLFPSNTTSTGYYGAITAKAVLAWQKKHAIAPDSEIDPLGGKVVGPKTRAKLNALYSQ